MTSRQKIRSHETKQAILASASALFTEKGYDAVTMREIAKAAGCSHTTIYIYFKDKEALLQQLATGPLQSLRQQLEAELNYPGTPEERLFRFTQAFRHFCLMNRNTYNILFVAKATRVDIEPDLEFQKLRNYLFGLVEEALRACLPGVSEEQALTFARIYFYNLHGVISLYSESAEQVAQLEGRLKPTFDLSAQVLLIGFREIVRKGWLLP
jgi:AcrR family transcriptional regulator